MAKEMNNGNVEELNKYREDVVSEEPIKVEVVKEEKKGFVQWYKGLPLWAKIAIPVGGVALGGFTVKVLKDVFFSSTDEVIDAAASAVTEVPADEVVENVVNF